MTKGIILSAVLYFCDLRADCLESKVTSDRELSIYSFGYPRASRRRLKFARPSSNIVFEEFVLSSLIAQFRYIKIQPKTIDLSTRLVGITTEFVGFIPTSLVLRSIVLG